jgi:ABC-type sugar transport system ATPase subunit
LKEIVFKNVGKFYGKTEVVKNLNLTIKDGERLILLGPSGCGKSTTLRMIAGLESITSGELYMEGKVANNIASGDRNVAMVFQNYALFPHMTVEDNITYGLKVNKLPREELSLRLKAAVNMLDLNGLEQRKPRDLSGGQRQRVALARAIVKRSKFLLLDEPLSNLDAQLRVRARKELVKIHEMYRQTFVYVTHDQIEAMTVGDRIALMYRGELQMVDTPHNVYNKPENVFVAQFIGSPPTNILEVDCECGKLKIGRQVLALPENWRRQVAISGATAFYFGIRPEHIRLSGKMVAGALIGNVNYLEDYGCRYGVYFEIDGLEVVAIADDDRYVAGQTIYFIPDFTKIHLFNRKTTQTIGYPTELLKKEEGNSYEYLY